ncbi:inorganic diphosphatase [Saccharomonospora sp. NPDC046836]|uniref:inorganic diphosphatase n=1 Tax=Saccharomonospora sp. NPDC046836 TaxID=3156921 RepID=UPI0033F31C3D
MSRLTGRARFIATVSTAAAVIAGLTAASALAFAQSEPESQTGAIQPAAAQSKKDCYPASHPLGFPQPATGDLDADGFFAEIEIPQDSFTKYETDAETGQIVVDRFQSMPVVYPGNYGSIPQSKGGDGDPLDVLVLTREPLYPAVQIQVKAIGVLNMIDGGEPDDKIIAVPVDDVDPDYTEANDIADLPQIERQRIEQFFAVYKNLPEGRKKVELAGFSDAAAARDEVKQAVSEYRKSCR